MGGGAGGRRARAGRAEEARAGGGARVNARTDGCWFLVRRART